MQKGYKKMDTEFTTDELTILEECVSDAQVKLLVSTKGKDLHPRRMRKFKELCELGEKTSKILSYKLGGQK